MSKMFKVIPVFVLIIFLISCISDKEKAEKYFKQGIDKMYKHDYQLAIDNFDKAIELNPKMDKAFFYRANLRFSKGDNKGALSDYNESIRINPECAADVYFNRGLLRFAEGDKNQACEDWTKAGELGKENIGDYLKRCK